jgi:hypothetical protein
VVADVKERTEGRTLRLITSDDYPAYKTATEHVYGTEVTAAMARRPARSHHSSSHSGSAAW